MFFKKIKAKINYLEDLIKSKDIEINRLKDEITELKDIKNIYVNRCECGHDKGLDRLILFDSDGYRCDASTRYEDGSLSGKLKQHARLYVCPKCGMVKAMLYEK